MNQTISLGGSGDTWDDPAIWDPRRSVYSSGRANGDEKITNNFDDYAQVLYKRNGIASACIGVRMFVFSEIRFLWQNRVNGRPDGGLFSDDALALIQEPWPGGTTGELTMRMEQDNSLAGNFYAAKSDGPEGQRLSRWYPPYVTIVTGSDDGNPWGSSARVVGYIYQVPGKEPEMWSPGSVVHYSPLPDPQARWRGMSWLTPVIEEILGDSAVSKHKTQFFKRGASTNLAISYKNARTMDQLKEQAEFFQEQFEGLSNAYRTIHLGAGAETTPIGSTLRQLDFKATQGSGESRIAAASLLGAVMAQFSEGMAGSSLNAGNFDASRKRAETVLFRPLWRIAAASLQRVLDKPSVNAELTYDPRDVAFLRDDAKNEADIRQKDSITIKQLIDAGFTPETVVAAMAAGNWQLLEHTGLFSVQLQAPGTAGSQNRLEIPAAAVPAMLEQGWTPAALPDLTVDAVSTTNVV